MSYALFWAEALITALLWAATAIARCAHIRRRWLARLALFLLLFGPFALFGAAAVGTGALKFSADFPHTWFEYSLSLLLAYLLGMAILLWRGRDGSARATGAFDWPRGRLTVGLLTAAAVLTMTLWNMDLEVRSQAAGLRTEAGAMMLSISPAHVNDSRNGAIFYEKAFAKIAADNAAFHGDKSPSDSKMPDQEPAALELLKRHELTLKLLRKGAAMPEARFDHDYANPSIRMLLPEVGQARTAVRLLQLDARHEMAHGQVEAAVADVNTMFALQRAVSDEPLLISLMVSAGMNGVAIETLGEILPEVTKAGQITGLDLSDSPFGAHAMMRTFQGEEAFGLSLFSDLMSGRENMKELAGMMNEDGSKVQFVALGNTGVQVLVRVFLMPDDVAAYRELMADHQQSVSVPYFQMAARAEDFARIRHAGVITSAIVPAIHHAREIAARAQAMHADAEVALAMTHYRLVHGSFPATLDALVPDFLDEIPADPFDGKPLRLAHKGDDWIIYSIGPDAKDDDGAAYDQKAKTGDLSFVLKVRK
ncbi:MAG TPA: hypothetical protein VFE47_07310 [Tepidisphaeraceae bacterium]|jgi:hypothetical protein|nr:hypothetical protein [Tepidisphaeraceae bacterium]